MRQCPFCGARANTREHVHPLWVSRRYTHEAGPNAYFTMSFHGLFPTRTARTLNQTVRVCGDCNSGWMSRVESAAKPIIEAMLDGSKRSLSREEGWSLARWLTKQACVVELLLPPDIKVAPPQAYVSLRAGQMPENWVVRVGVMAGGRRKQQHNLGRIRRWVTPSPAQELRLHTISWERLAAQVVVHNLAVRPTFDALFGGNDWSVTIFAWDNSAIGWPPRRKFTGEGIANVSNLAAPPN